MFFSALLLLLLFHLNFNLGYVAGQNSISKPFVEPCNPRFVYNGDGWMLDLEEKQSVTMKEALKRSIR